MHCMNEVGSCTVLLTSSCIIKYPGNALVNMVEKREDLYVNLQIVGIEQMMLNRSSNASVFRSPLPPSHG